MFAADHEAREEIGEGSSRDLEGSLGPEEAILVELHTENWGIQAQGGTQAVRSVVHMVGDKNLGIVVAADSQEDLDEGPEVVEVAE